MSEKKNVKQERGKREKLKRRIKRFPMIVVLESKKVPNPNRSIKIKGCKREFLGVKLVVVRDETDKLFHVRPYWK